MATDTEVKAEAGSKGKPRKTSTKAQERRQKEAALVEQMIESFQGKFKSGELKPTVGDFIRLVQLDQELGDEQPKEIKISWIEPSEKEPASDT